MSHRDQRFKFDSDFDFEKANEKFQEQLSDVEKLLSNANLERGNKLDLEICNFFKIILYILMPILLKSINKGTYRLAKFKLINFT